MKFYKCNKCTSIAISDEVYHKPTVCIAPMLIRTSGICGGGFTQITKEEYEAIESSFPKQSD